MKYFVHLNVLISDFKMAEAYFDLMDKTSKRGSKKLPRGDVTTADMTYMRLPASMCRRNNEEILKRGLTQSPDDPQWMKCWKRNRHFMVMSEDSGSYCGGLVVRHPMKLNPSSVCPNPQRHRELIRQHTLGVRFP